MNTMLCTGKDTRPDLDLCEKSWHVKRSLCAKAARQLYHYENGYRIVSVIYSRKNNYDDPFKCVEKTISDMNASRMMIDCSDIRVVHKDRMDVEIPKPGFFLLGSYIENVVYGLVQVK